jgi:hypothetical protein
MIAHPKTSVYGRWTHASELPEGLFRAAFGVPRMRVSVFSVVDTLRKLLTPKMSDCTTFFLQTQTKNAIMSAMKKTSLTQGYAMSVALATGCRGLER